MPRERHGGAFLLVDSTASPVAVAQRETLLAQRRDFAIETTLTGSSALRLLRSANALGSRVTLVYVGLTSADLSVQRVLDRVAQGGHAVPVAALERRFPDTMSKFATAIGAADRSYVFDDSGHSRRLLLTREGGRTVYAAPELPDWARTALTDPSASRDD